MAYSYHRPTSVDEACRMSTEMEGSRFIAGGTDLMPQIHQRRRNPGALISLLRIEELNTVSFTESEVRIGSAVSLTSLESHPQVRRHFPALVEAVHWLGSRQIRNVATLGGNLCNASPAADTAPPLLVYGARVELSNGTVSRTLPLEEFLLGPGQTAIEPGELLAGILIAVPGEDTKAVFLRKGRVTMDLAIVSVAALVKTSAQTPPIVRIAAGAVAPTPRRLVATESIASGSGMHSGTWEQLREEAAGEVAPITDLRSSAAYRRHLTGVLVERALKLAAPSPGGSG